MGFYALKRRAFLERNSENPLSLDLKLFLAVPLPQTSGTILCLSLYIENFEPRHQKMLVNMRNTI
jgi:hypothetical protein